MNNQKRVLEEKVDLDYQAVQKFFEERGANKHLDNKYNYVLFQDDDPELAVRRDAMEKEKIGALLQLQGGHRVLDIGCGIGRWGEYLLEKNAYYVGMDASSHMIQMAEENLKDFTQKKLIVGMFQELLPKLKAASETALFDKIFVNGVFMYLNDEDYRKALSDIHTVCAKECEIYVKESMGTDCRLTLNQIYSESLSQSYSAIYRSIAEYRESLTEEFGGDFEMVSDGRLFDKELENRKETVDYYFLWRRRG